MAIERIISGGQTGVDRAALDAALESGIDHGGWCPRGRRAEDGPIAPRYQLQETEVPHYHVRTRLNVLDSDATLILCRGSVLQGGTALTAELARRNNRPCLVVDLDATEGPVAALDWLRANRVTTLNVAGPRESQCPGISTAAMGYLMKLLRDVQRPD